MCSEHRVKLMYLLLYSPDLNPIEELFVELKALLNGTGSCMKMIMTKGFMLFLNSVLTRLVQGNKVQRGISDTQV